jgi:hypothetical protein
MGGRTPAGAGRVLIRDTGMERKMGKRCCDIAFLPIFSITVYPRIIGFLRPRRKEPLLPRNYSILCNDRKNSIRNAIRMLSVVS